MTEKRKPGRPRVARAPGRPCLYERVETVQAVQRVLDGLEIVDVDTDVQLALQRIMWRRDYFHQDGAGHITLLLRTILESEGNGPAALVEPVVTAIHDTMRPQWTRQGLRWIEVFDGVPMLSLLETLRSLQIFSEKSLGTYLGHAVRNRLWAAFGPDPVVQPAPEVKTRRPRVAAPAPSARPPDRPSEWQQEGPETGK